MTTEVAKPNPQGAYKEGMQALLREAGPRLFMAYYNRLKTDEVKTDDLRKGVEMIFNATDVALEKKTDANANLPVFNITFDMKSGVVAEAPVPVVEVVEAAPAEEIEDAVYREIDEEKRQADVAAMFAMLDEVLGEPLEP